MTIGAIIDGRGSPLSVKPTDSVQSAARIMAERRIGFLLILNADGSLAGVVSERDVVREVAQGREELGRLEVLEIATRTVTTCTPADDPHAVFDRMTDRKFRHMPVEDDGRIVGVVSMSDLLRHFERDATPDAKAKAFQAFLSGEMVPGG